MTRDYFLRLAATGIRMPIGADLVLREYDDAEAILRDGQRLGPVIAEAAARFRMPLAMPVMDLTLEKAFLLRDLGIPEADIAAWHFSTCPAPEQVEQLRKNIVGPLDERLTANIDAIRHIARHTSRVPVGMGIGPFSLMTKLVGDPIVPVMLAGSGITGAEDPEVRTVETVMELAIAMVLRSLEAQIKAGAQAIFLAEPAANKVYISPNQMADGSDVFDRFVLRYNRRICELLDKHRVSLLFHCCGELVEPMIRGFCSLRPAVLSLGSSRRLWEDASFVPKDVVLFGNLPSKKFYSDALITAEEVARQADQLEQKMRAVGHPFILGSECDILSVPGCEGTIARKVDALVNGRCHLCPSGGDTEEERAA